MGKGTFPRQVLGSTRIARSMRIVLLLYGMPPEIVKGGTVEIFKFIMTSDEVRESM